MRTERTPNKPPSSLFLLPRDAATREALRRLRCWFADAGWTPFPFQRRAAATYLNGASGLVHSATGTGKTLAVSMGPLLEALRDVDRTPAAKQAAPPLRLLWITPLRALAADTENALRHPLTALALPWTLERRTGDTAQSAKARQLRRLPTALITTPESLSLMLTHERLHEQFAGLRCVVVDEWHELLGTKRGVQTELALARLRRLNPRVQTWGVSATLGNLDEALAALCGANPAGPTTVIRGHQKKRIELQSLLPPKIERFPWAGHIGTRMVPEVAQLIDSVQSMLIFANTRNQTELWYQALLKHRPDLAGQVALHHGSLDMDVRRWVEQSLRDGRLKAVVCTSSLDLGVDFTAVEMVVQIGSAKGAARLLQRAGRSGHQPDAASRLAFVPTHAWELVELAGAQAAIRQGHIEARQPLSKPLDVLAQHAVTIAIGGGFDPQELLDEVRTARSYRELTAREWQWVLRFVTQGGESLTAYPEFHRVAVSKNGRYHVASRKVATLHRMNIGTITSEASMQVKWLKGGSLGTVEELFVAKLKPGDRFQFAGRLLQLVRVRDNVVYVRRGKGRPDTVPRWMGGRIPLSSELADALRTKLQEAADGNLQGPEMRRLKPLLAIQSRWSIIPRRDELLVEQIKTREGHHVFIFPFEGRLAHEGLAAVFAHRLSQKTPLSLSMACNDYGIVLHSRKPIGLEAGIDGGLFALEQLEEDIAATLNATELTRRQFREIARVAGLVHSGYPSSPRSARNVQASSNLLHDVFAKYDPDNLLLEQARREVLQHKLQSDRMAAALTRIHGCRIRVEHPPKVTPMAFPLLIDRMRERLSSESLEERIRSLQQTLEQAADE